MIVQGGSGDGITDCPYTKHTQVTEAHQGTVYAVVGCSGETGSVQSGWPHPANVSVDEQMKRDRWCLIFHCQSITRKLCERCRNRL
jgi:hypothetical protein